ncbi:MAG TPA: hypothetical protein VFG20_13100, partial [Planctomycetaceae bacterium]|nr:hypothetical protein [Planctomycetaceae bacterium]
VYVPSAPVMTVPELPAQVLSPAPAPIPAPVTTAPQSYVIVNATNQPVTYAIRTAGTQWGSYTVPAGQHHEYSVPSAEMELKYVGVNGEQVISIPGQHAYAFAQGENGLGLFLADAQAGQ